MSAGSLPGTGERVRAAWLDAPASRAVLAALAAAGRPARFVGGCVRDALLEPGADAADLDLATPELPERVLALLAAAGLRSAPTGLKHGTVTAFAGGRSFEITTLRRDVACFGRHAQVEFTDDFAADAARRDFTINTMSCDGAGRLFDPCAGRADLAAGRVRFVGAAAQRIAEDHLRILRFFRFHARFGREPADAEALAACAAAAESIDRLSGERIRQELFRILMTGRVLVALDLMARTGVLARLLPWPAAPDHLARLMRHWPEADPLLRLACLTRAHLPSRTALAGLAERLRLANAEALRLERLLTGPLPDPAAPPRARRQDLYRLGAEPYADLVRLAVAVRGADAAAAALALHEAAAWRPPSLPVTGADLLARGVPSGPGLGSLLAELRAAWEAADFTLDRPACLALLDRL
ncbi:MAG: CCA tRNA nucleotidyltransferase, partial [Geminicoccaceae bacterium]